MEIQAITFSPEYKGWQPNINIENHSWKSNNTNIIT